MQACPEVCGVAITASSHGCWSPSPFPDGVSDKFLLYAREREGCNDDNEAITRAHESGYSRAICVFVAKGGGRAYLIL
jgi:hypothetical protein